MEEIKKEKREEYVIKIGALLKQLLEDQKKNINDAGYGCLKVSDYDAGELLAKKIIDKFGGIKRCKKDIL